MGPGFTVAMPTLAIVLFLVAVVLVAWGFLCRWLMRRVVDPWLRRKTDLTTGRGNE